jgi:pyruvate dehydrogenase E1 component alpha subunit/2-oxoisovalerate dehydrogenase E1 component alpha subunit
MAKPDGGQRRRHLHWICLARRLEQRIGSLYRRGLLAASAFLGTGHEALSAACGMHLRPGDVYAPLIRDMAGRLAFGEEIGEALRVYLGKRDSHMRGRDGNIHRGDIEQGLLPMISHLGAMGAVVAGMMLARRLREPGRTTDLDIGLVSFGDGTMATGAAHEALNLTAVERLPLVFVVANNGYAYSTTNERSFACAHLVDRARAYGIAGRDLDGLDPDACLDVIGEAVAAARAGAGPQLVAATLLRRCGHGEHDDFSYRPPGLLERTPDPYETARRQAVADGLLDAAELASLDTEIGETLDHEVEAALAAADPDPLTEDWCAYSERWASEGLRP